MRLNQLLVAAQAIVAAVGCAKSNIGPDASGSGDASGTIDSSGGGPDASCGNFCDADGDGVLDQNDDCPGTPTGRPVNLVGCADSQVDPTLQPDFPPYGLTWTPTGDIGRAGGLTWTYTGIQRADLFHIYWIPCDDPDAPCAVSLDGPLDNPAEGFVFSAGDSDLPGGKLVYTDSTHILLADSSTPALTGRLTLQIHDVGGAVIPWADVGTLGVTTRTGTHGAEIPGTGYSVVAIIEVDDGSSGWTPYLDYYDAAPTPDTGGSATVSFGGSFYDE